MDSSSCTLARLSRMCTQGFCSLQDYIDALYEISGRVDIYHKMKEVDPESAQVSLIFWCPCGTPHNLTLTASHLSMLIS